VARLHPRAPGSFFVTSYGSQGYGGGIRTHLHTGLFPMWSMPRCYNRDVVGQLVSCKSAQLIGGEEKTERLVWDGHQPGSLSRELQFSRCELLLLEAGSWGTGIVREPKVRGTAAAGSRYQATDNRDCNRLKALVCVWQWFVSGQSSHQSELRL
jgi:hypothetical protein